MMKFLHICLYLVLSGLFLSMPAFFCITLLKPSTRLTYTETHLFSHNETEIALFSGDVGLFVVVAVITVVFFILIGFTNSIRHRK